MNQTSACTNPAFSLEEISATQSPARKSASTAGPQGNNHIWLWFKGGPKIWGYNTSIFPLNRENNVDDKSYMYICLHVKTRLSQLVDPAFLGSDVHSAGDG